MFMNVIVNPEVTIFHHSEEKQKKIMNAINSANYNLKYITLRSKCEVIKNDNDLNNVLVSDITKYRREETLKKILRY